MVESLKPFYTALLAPVARLAIKSKIHPNIITLAGVCVSLLAAWHAAQGKWFFAALYIGIGSCMDGLDGAVARQTKNSSWGAVFDSTSDRITEIAWLSGLLFFYINASGGRLGAYMTFAAMSGSLMVSYVRARCEGVGVPCSSGMAQRPERILILVACLLAGKIVMVWGLVLLSVLTYATVVQRLIVAYRFCKKSNA